MTSESPGTKTVAGTLKGVSAVSGSSSDPPRVAWLDGTRGLAAIQVVLLHYASAFLPAIGLHDPTIVHFGWENGFIHTPLFLPFDGYSAVYIFFVLSGVALTYSFGACPYAIPSGVVRRIIRLGVPTAGGLLLGAMWFSLWPGAQVTASRITGSPWLAALGGDPVTTANIIHQIGLEGMFAGYDDASTLPGAARRMLHLVSLFRSFDPPLWTLHFEFVGSLIVLGLVALRRAVGRRTHLAICLLLIFALASSVLFLFIAGHLAADWLRSPPARRRNIILGVGLCALGVLLCTTATLGVMIRVRQFFPAPFIGRHEAAATMQLMYGALAGFFGIACLPRMQAVLAGPRLRWLGKISFSLYLTHFPLLIIVGSAAFVLVAAQVPYLVAVLVVTVVMGGLLGLALAVGFEILVDRPAIALSRRVFATLQRRR
jgi:peptidoglycan/LPS O-acetylase OafA/YrhL